MEELFLLQFEQATISHEGRKKFVDSMCEIAKGTQLVICSLEVCEGSCRGNSLSLLDNIRWNEERDDSIHVSYLHIIVIDLCIEGGILLVKVEERDPSKHVTLHVVKVKD